MLSALSSQRITELLFSFQSLSLSIPVHLFRKLLFSFPGKSFFPSLMPLKKKERKKYIPSLLQSSHTERGFPVSFSFFFVYSVPRTACLIPTLSRAEAGWPRVDTEETFLKICSHPPMKGRMKTLLRAASRAGWKACSFTCFGLLYFPDSKARDRMTRAGLCYKICTQTCLFHRDFSLPT